MALAEAIDQRRLAQLEAEVADLRASMADLPVIVLELLERSDTLEGAVQSLCEVAEQP